MQRRQPQLPPELRVGRAPIAAAAAVMAVLGAGPALPQPASRSLHRPLHMCVVLLRPFAVCRGCDGCAGLVSPQWGHRRRGCSEQPLCVRQRAQHRGAAQRRQRCNVAQDEVCYLRKW